MQARQVALQLIKSRNFDLVIVGGGIVGAGVAQNAAARGLKVALIDKGDFASGTSSKTTKLIHGGLRYLEQFDFRLTRELCQERGLLEQMAPQLVKDFSFILPIGEQSKFFGWKARAGLTVYDLLGWNAAGLRKHERLSKKDVLGHAPSLSPDKIVEGLRFHDCITDDSRLVLEVLKTACERGAIIANYVEAKEIQTSKEQNSNSSISGLLCHDRYSGEDFVIRCSKIVNATGVWTDELMGKLCADWQPRVAPAKGVHLMLPASSFETNSALFLPSPMADNRYIFVVPWQKALMVGTTDTRYNGSLDAPLATGDEIDYLLKVLNTYSRNRTINRSDVSAAWAGLRPLVRGESPHTSSSSGSSPPNENDSKTANLSREHEIIEGAGGIIGLIGGKLTNFRMLAAHVVDRVIASMPTSDDRSITLKEARTNEIMIGGWRSKDDYLTSSAEIAARARRAGIEPATMDHLISSYGKDALQIVAMSEADPELNKRICPEFPPIDAEIVFTLKQEMAVSLEDILFRRIRLAMVDQKQCAEKINHCAALAAKTAGWDATRKKLEIDAMHSILQDHMEFICPEPTASSAARAE